MSLEGRGEALGGRSSEMQTLGCLLSHIPLYFTAQEAYSPKVLVAGGTNMGVKKCCRLVDIPVTTT